MNIYSIYRIRNQVNNKVYIGWTSRDPERRFEEHQNTHKPKNQDRSAISYAIEKHGVENFTYEILYQTLDETHSKEIESWFITENNSLVDGNGYNKDLGGTGHKRSADTIEKHRLKIIGRKQSTEHIAKRFQNRINPMIGKSGELHQRYGKVWTEEQRKKISDGVKESIKKRKENGSYIRKSHSVETIEKMKETKRQQAAEGKLWSQSEEGRAAISKKLIGTERSDRQKSIAKESNTGNYLVESETTGQFIIQGIKEFATSVGLTVEQFRYTMISGKYKNGYRLLEILGKTHSINKEKE